MKICKQCNLTYDDYVNYCPTCGQLLEKYEEKKTCSKCGFALEDYMAFCPQCGTSANFNEHENSISPNNSPNTNMEHIDRDNSAETVVSADRLVTKRQILFTLVCIVIALISFIGMGIKTHATFAEELLSAFVVGTVALYLLIYRNCIKREEQKEKEKKNHKVVIVTLVGIIGFIPISVIYCIILYSCKLSLGIPKGMDFFNGLAFMVGQTGGTVGFIMLISAGIFKIAEFVTKIFKKG